jgi:hypothetical protein
MNPQPRIYGVGRKVILEEITPMRERGATSARASTMSSWGRQASMAMRRRIENLLGGYPGCVIGKAAYLDCTDFVPCCDVL